jgi:hypothetical protein
MRFKFTANYSRLTIDLEFQRLSGYYLIQLYIPCNMLIILCWISFFLNKNSMNVRIILCFTSLALLIFGIANFNSQVPKTSYTKALDNYTGVCMTFIFVAIVGKLIFRIFMTFKLFNLIETILELACISNSDDFKSTKTPLSDKVLRILYPLLFAAYNVLYALYYCC